MVIKLIFMYISLLSDKKLCKLLFAIFVDLRPPREFFTHMETSGTENRKQKTNKHINKQTNKHRWSIIVNAAAVVQ